MLLRQLRDGRAEVENEYGRVVRTDGNPQALAALDGGVRRARRLRVARSRRDPAQRACASRTRLAPGMRRIASRFPALRIEDPKACRCGDVLRGLAKPYECGVFGTACTPEQPLGTCMVSSEGACAAYYAYGRHQRREKATA